MSSQPIEIVVTDLDGTLWAREAQVSDTTRTALAELERRGIPLLAATGRRLRSARLALVRADLPHVPCVGLNGALAADRGEVFHSAAFAPDQARVVYDLFVAGGIVPVGYLVPELDGDSVDAVAPEGVSTHPDHLAVLAPTLSTDPIDFALMVAFSVLGLPYAALDPIRVAIEGRHTADCVLTADRAYGDFNLAATAAGVSKWTGVLAYCARHGIDPTRVLAIGDDDNDVTMLKNAAIGLAMSHASPAARAAADASVDDWTEVLGYL
jgi:hydroxymethylpyrimidine pyrophosphatase-like HAD family hydrolase